VLGTHEGSDEDVLLVTGCGPDTTGWFFLIDRDGRGRWSVEQIDGLPSFGIAVHDGVLYRMLCSAPGIGSSAELLVYDHEGVVSYRRLDGVVDPHGIVWDGSRFVIPCPAVNGLALLDASGTIAGWIRLPGTGDAWHVNGVAVRRGVLYASAFGRFEPDRGWAANPAGHGLIFAVNDLRPVVAGLHCPHDPSPWGEAWVVCDSGSGRLLARSAQTGAPVREAHVGGWPRGLAFLPGLVAVGVSGRRYAQGEVELASLAVLDAGTWHERERIALPCQEVNSVARVPRSFIGALRRGFRTNAMRTSVQDREDVFRQVGNIHPSQPMTPMTELARDDARIRFDAVAPSEIVAGERFSLEVSVRNEGSRTLFTAMPFPVLVGYRWLKADREGEVEALDERRFALPEPLAPGASCTFPMTVAAPSLAGTYRLRMTLVQEWIRWFDADDAAMRVELTLAVSPRRKSTIFGESHERFAAPSGVLPAVRSQRGDRREDRDNGEVAGHRDGHRHARSEMIADPAAAEGARHHSDDHD